MGTLSSQDDSAAQAQDVTRLLRPHPEFNPLGQQTGYAPPEYFHSNAVSRHARHAGPSPSGLKSLDTVYIGKPYSPCTLRLRDLTPILFADLIINHHHRGRLLLVKLISTADASRTTTIVNVEDTSGNIELLSVNLAFMDMKFAHDWPKPGLWFVIKEPFFAIEEEGRTKYIRIDHSSDFVDVRGSSLDLLGHDFLATICPKDNKRTPLSCKEAGNAALRAKNLDAALASYTDGLLLSIGKTGDPNRIIKQDLLRNRSHVRLALGYYEGATTDAMAAVTHISDAEHKKLDAKAYFRAACASYKLKHFDLVKRCLQAQLELTPGDRNGEAMTKRNEARLHEQQQGRYNISAIEETIYSHPRVDAADYIVNTDIKISGPNRGRGLFATQDMELGDLVMAETAFCCVWGHEKSYHVCPQRGSKASDGARPANVGLWRETLTKATRNPVRGSELLHLHSGYKGTESRVSETDDLLMTDSYHIRDIVTHTSFSMLPVKASDAETQNSGVWIRASYINHSCIPNTARIFHGDMMMLHTTRPIKKGEEIIVSYLPFDRYDGRDEVIESIWGFRCDCPLCVADSRCPELIRMHRADMNLILQNYRSLNIGKTSSVIKMEIYSHGIADSYRADLYPGLPKVDVAKWRLGLLLASCLANDTSIRFTRLFEVLLALGFKVDTEGEQISKISPTAYSVLSSSSGKLCGALLEQAVLAHNNGHADVAKHLYDFARSLERVSRGTDQNTLRVYNEQIERSSLMARSGTQGLVEEMRAMRL